MYNEVTLAEKQNIRLVGVGLTGDDVSRKFYHFIEVTSLNHLDKGFKDLFNNFPLGVQCLPGSIPKGEVPILDLKIPCILTNFVFSIKNFILLKISLIFLKIR